MGREEKYVKEIFLNLLVVFKEVLYVCVYANTYVYIRIDIVYLEMFGGVGVVM